MKASLVKSLMAGIFSFIVLSSCSTSTESEQISYQTNEWPSLMRDYSQLDERLSSLSPAHAPSDASFTHFETFLLATNLSKPIIDKLIAVLVANDFKFDRPAYHGLIHTIRVGNLTTSSLSTSHANLLSEEQKILLAFAAFLHDIDPNRIKGTPPRVSETFKWMDNHNDIKFLLDDLEREKNIKKDQIKSLIKYTDFDLDPKKLAAIIDDADKMTEQNFDAASAPTLKTWGRRLAYLDQVAMYVGSFPFATQAVVGLAHEFRRVAILKLRAENKMYTKERLAPGDVEILSNTAKFLSLRINDPNFVILPTQMQENFRHIHKSFETKWTGKTSLK